MKLVTIVAGSASEALAEVHRQLGPNAVVVNVRKASAPGLSRIWKTPKIEVQATLPESQPKPPRPNLAELTRNLEKLKKQRKAVGGPLTPKAEFTSPPSAPKDLPARPTNRVADPKRSDEGEEIGLGRMLENLGILPLHAQWLVDQVHVRHAGSPPNSLRDQFVSVQESLVEYWGRLASRANSNLARTRVLIGSAGVGKTTCLCKWLTHEVLLQNRSARVWRLDGSTANTAEFLSIHGEILGVSVERIWPSDPASEPVQAQFVDLPGVAIENAEAIAGLGEQIEALGPSQVFLVLNSAYELSHLVAHVRAFAGIPLDGLILTHLDEDSRWSKFWNLLLGTKLPVLYMSAGQNIPGDFTQASPQTLFDIGLDRELG